MGPGTAKLQECDGTTTGVRAHLCPLTLALGGLAGAKPPSHLTKPPCPFLPSQQPLCRLRASTSRLDALRQHKAKPRGVSAAIFSAPLLTNKLLGAGDSEASTAAGAPPCAPAPCRASWPVPLGPSRPPGTVPAAMPSPNRFGFEPALGRTDPEMSPLRNRGERLWDAAAVPGHVPASPPGSPFPPAGAVGHNVQRVCR